VGGGKDQLSGSLTRLARSHGGPDEDRPDPCRNEPEARDRQRIVNRANGTDYYMRPPESSRMLLEVSSSLHVSFTTGAKESQPGR
jgi:hypothetical protein